MEIGEKIFVNTEGSYKVGTVDRTTVHEASGQDRFIILSRGPYSAIPSDVVGIAEGAWLRQSLDIRREHECVHYLTYRLVGLIRSVIIKNMESVGASEADMPAGVSL